MEENQNKVKIITNIKKQDLYNFNMYIISRNKNISSIIFGAVFILWAIVDICLHKQQGLVGNIIIIVIGILFILYKFVFFKLMMMKKVNKLDLQDLEPIDVELTDEGILYQLEKEVEENYNPYAWNLIAKVVESDYYLFIHLIDRRTILFIKKEDITNSEFILFLQEKVESKKYVKIESKKQY